MFLIIPSRPRYFICKAASAVGAVGRHSSRCSELCAQMPAPKSGSHQVGFWPWAPSGWEALGVTGSVSSWPGWKRICPAQTRWSPCPALKSSQPVAWTSGQLFPSGIFSALGGEGAIELHVHHTRPSGGWVCHVISALKMLLFLCTVSELDFPPMERILLCLLFVFILF